MSQRFAVLSSYTSISISTGLRLLPGEIGLVGPWYHWLLTRKVCEPSRN